MKSSIKRRFPETLGIAFDFLITACFYLTPVASPAMIAVILPETNAVAGTVTVRMTYTSFSNLMG
jgi:hypothetical protein